MLVVKGEGRCKRDQCRPQTRRDGCDCCSFVVVVVKQSGKSQAAGPLTVDHSVAGGCADQYC